MRVLASLQAGVLQRPFSYLGRHYLCASLLWPFRLESGEAALAADMWQALSDHFKQGRVFDQGMVKERAEFLCLGSFHAPGGRPLRQSAISVRVANRTKKLVVSGPRTWRAGGTASAAEPIESLPIRYDHAYGGEGYADNPLGEGHVELTDADSGERYRPLPRIEYPSTAVSSPSQTPPPASLEGIDIGWRPRQRYGGTYDEAYLRERMPGLPDDVDWRLFNEACEDQWFDDFLRGDEDFELINMMPDHERFTGALPGVRGRVFIESRPEQGGPDAELDFHEIPLRLDTVWLLPDAGLGVVVHRGTTEVRDDEASEIVNLMAAHESLKDGARELAHYRDEMKRRGDPEEGYRYILNTKPLLPLGCPCAIQEMLDGSDTKLDYLSNDNFNRYAERQQEQAREQVDERVREIGEQGDADPAELAKVSDAVTQGLERMDSAQGDAPQDESSAELQRIVEKIAPGSSTGGEVDLTQVDFDAFDELSEYAERQVQERTDDAKSRVRDQIEEMKRADDSGSEEAAKAIAQAEQALARMDEPPALPRMAESGSVDQALAQLDEIDAYREELAAGGVAPEQIKAQLPDTDAMREQVATAERQMAEQYRDTAHYLPPSVSPHPGEEPERRQRLLDATGDAARGGDFAFVDLRGVTLRDLDLRAAYLEYVDLTGATLINVDLREAILAKARLVDCRFERVRLEHANVGASEIRNARFEQCDFTDGHLGRARIAESTFERCRFAERQEMFLETGFERVGLIECTVEDAAFYQVDLTRCRFRATRFSECQVVQCDLAHADFTEADLNRVAIVSTPAPGAIFDRATMDKTCFIDEPVLNDCSFREAQLTNANCREADATGADFSRALLDGTDFTGADLTGARFERAHAVGTQFQKAELGSADFTRTDLREASLMKARLLRTRFRGANLYSVSFLHATLGDTDFADANLDNTILRDWRPS